MITQPESSISKIVIPIIRKGVFAPEEKKKNKRKPQKEKRGETTSQGVLTMPENEQCRV
jgi:hypothetical protein